MTSNTLFPTAAPDFSDPLGLLRACHERIFQHCEIVERLAQHLADNGLDPESREAAAKIYRYFSTAAQHHHADEEEDLFPRLATRSLHLADTLQLLRQEHQQLDALWQELEPLLAEPVAIDDTAAFADLANRFAEAYRNHVGKENEGVLDMAQQLLDQSELKQIGMAMAERRGIALPDDFQA